MRTTRSTMNELIRRCFGLGLAGLLPIWLEAAVASAAEDSGAARPAPPVQAHAFFAADIHKNSVYKVDEKGVITWSYNVGAPHDLWLLPNDHILLLKGASVLEISPEKKIVWSFDAGRFIGKPLGLHSCQRLENGNTLVAYSSGDGVHGFLEIDPSGKMVVKVDVPVKRGSTRLCRKTPEGTYLFGMYGGGELREYDAVGQVLRRFPVPWGAYMGERLPGGNTLVACGEGHAMIEFDKEGKIVWEIKENDLPGCPLRFVAGFQRLANGNTVICNWGGHGHMGKQAQIIEVTPDKRIVWQVFDFEKFGSPAQVRILSAGNPPR